MDYYLTIKRNKVGNAENTLSEGHRGHMCYESTTHMKRPEQAPPDTGSRLVPRAGEGQLQIVRKANFTLCELCLDLKNMEEAGRI